MAETPARRRLAAILAADVVGYSRLMERDEAGTLAALKARRRDVVDPLVAKHHGRIFKTVGDGVLVEFASAVDAVQCAVGLQQGMAAASSGQPEDGRLVLRIGINLGDVMVEDDDLYGDGVNIAARLEGLAEPGGILLSGTAYEHIRNKIAVAFDDLGAQTLKNIAEPVRVYRVAGVSTSTTAAPRTATTKPSIAVLPFTNMSGDPEQEYFSDGITEDIITELSRFRSLLVLARHSSFAFKGRAMDITEIARKLGARYVIEGSVRRAGNRIRVTAQLIEAATGNHLWAERYDREMQDLFAIQDELARAVAATVGDRIGAAGRARAVALSPNALEAYDLLLRAKALHLKFTKSDNEQARLLARRAIEIDPTNAQAHAYYANACVNAYLAYWADDLDRHRAEALEHAKRAVILDDTNNDAHWVLGLIHNSRREYEEARFHIERALENNPNDTEARGVYAIYLNSIGNPEAALEQFELIRRLNPFELSWFPLIKGWVYFNARRYEDAIASLKQLPEPVNDARAVLAASYAHAGRSAEAKAMLEEFLRVAEHDMAVFPGRRLGDWEEFWRGMAWYKREADHQHLMDGLRKAGLPD
jgi:TolB-like protein